MDQEKLELIPAEQFEKLSPGEVAGKCVSKKDFFALTSLRDMEPVAAEGTYSRWLASGRVKETREVFEDLTGLTEDKVEITVPARYVNSERRRTNENARIMREHAAKFPRY